MAIYRETVTRVIDGDTFETSARKVRLKNVNAPELGTTKGTRSKTYLTNLIDGKRVKIDTGSEPVTSYGRDVADVYRISDNRHINRAMRAYISRL